MWQESDWETALAVVAERLGRVVKQHSGAQIGALAAPTSTLEEFHLLGAHRARPRQRQSRSSPAPHRFPRRGERSALSRARLLDRGAGAGRARAGRRLATCVRKCRCSRIACARRRCAARKISFVNPQRYEYLFPVAQLPGVERPRHVRSAGRDRRGCKRGERQGAPESIAALVASAQPTDAHRAIAQQLGDGSRRMILLGALAQRDPAFADLRLVAARSPS